MNYLIFIFFISLAIVCKGKSSDVNINSSQEWIIKGHISGAEGKLVFLAEQAFFKNEQTLDSVLADSAGDFVFKTKNLEPTIYVIGVKGSVKVDNRFIVDGPLTQVSGKLDDLSSLTVLGSKEDKLFKRLLGSFGAKQTMDKFKIDIQKALAVKDMAETRRLDSLARLWMVTDLKDSLVNFVVGNNGTLVSAIALAQVRTSISDNEFMRYLGLMKSGTVGNHSIISYFQNLSEAERKTFKIGDQVPGFSQPDIYGNKVELGKINAKYILIDFWASWCTPCRIENQNLVKTYSKYKNRGFEILSVSLDHSKKLWGDAIAQDLMTWRNVSDLKGMDNEAGKLFGIVSLPEKYLVDSNGKILAIGLTGVQLESKLVELIGEK